MRFVLETVKILLLFLIVVLLSADQGLLSLPQQSAILERLGINSREGTDSRELEMQANAQQVEALGYEQAVIALAPSGAETPALAGSGNLDPAPQGETAAVKRVDTDGQPLQAQQGVEQGASLSDDVDVGAGTDEDPTYNEAANHGLEALLRQRLSGRYEFPGHVKFRDTQLTVRRLFADAGIDVAREQEVVFAAYCGDYSAPNPAGLYGAYRPFFAEVLVNHADQSIDGELWLDVEGDIKKSISFRSDLLISARQESFDSRLRDYCASREGFLPDEYANYKAGQLAPYYRQHFAEMARKAGDPDYAERLLECVKTEVTLKECYRNLGG